MPACPKIRSTSTAALKQAFNQALHAIWRKDGSKAQIGLAISGGVDSMALATLCNEGAKLGHPGPAFRALIVDHGLRENSSLEAAAVAEELRRLRITPEILKPKWKDHPNSLSRQNLESSARRLRYQTLGKACRAHGITALLVAHHADDQAETVLIRILNKYTGRGLAGMQQQMRIPECEGIYGVCESGGLPPSSLRAAMPGSRHDAPMSIETGGVTTLRPLLPFRKADLIDVCREAGTKWFEDHTNADRGLALRNTIRYLHKEDALPAVLQPQSLLAVAERTRSRSSDVDHVVREALRKTKIGLDLRTGSAICSFQPALATVMLAGNDTYAVACGLLREVLLLMAPSDGISLQDLHDAVGVVLPGVMEGGASPSTTSASRSINVSSVCIIARKSTTGEELVFMHRSPPNMHSAKDAVTGIPSLERIIMPDTASSLRSTWHLWDARYWIRVSGPAPASGETESVAVRFFTMRDISALRRLLEPADLQSLHRALRAAPGFLRLTLPAIVFRSNDIDEQVMALPSIGWSAPGWRRWRYAHGTDHVPPNVSGWTWDIRYKHVDFEQGLEHQLIPVSGAVKESFESEWRENSRAAKRVKVRRTLRTRDGRDDEEE